jgi:glutamate 5-kinase
MSARRKPDLNHRLEAYFATLRSSSLRETLKRRTANWQIYAAVTGSAMAMATTSSASIIGTGIRHVSAEPVASALPIKQNFASSQNTSVANAIRLAMARQNTGQMLFAGAAAQHGEATASQAPSILPHGIVPLDGVENTIQSGELVTIYGKNLAKGTFTWKGDFPTSLGGRASKSIKNRPISCMSVPARSICRRQTTSRSARYPSS